MEGLFCRISYSLYLLECSVRSKSSLCKGKGLEAHNKDNYRGIAMFSVFCKVFEMILLRKLEQIAEEKGYFSHMQFAFSKGVGCLEASYVICHKRIYQPSN